MYPSALILSTVYRNGPKLQIDVIGMLSEYRYWLVLSVVHAIAIRWKRFVTSSESVEIWLLQVMHGFEAESEGELTLNVGDYVVVRQVWTILCWAP